MEEEKKRKKYIVLVVVALIALLACADIYLLGQAKITSKVSEIMEDFAGWVSGTSAIVIMDARPPVFRNLSNLLSNVPQNAHMHLFFEAMDYNAVDIAFLSTNQTGSWVNYTASYGAPLSINSGASQWASNNFTWSDQSVPVGTIVSWRVWANDSSNNWNASDTLNFTITSADNTAPVVQNLSVSLIAENTTFNFTADVADNVNLDYIAFEINGTSYIPNHFGGNIYNYTLNTSLFPANTYIFVARGRDLSNNWGQNTTSFTVVGNVTNVTVVNQTNYTQTIYLPGAGAGAAAGGGVGVIEKEKETIVKEQVERLYVCGNGACETAESQSNCCMDCGCPPGRNCVDNFCTPAPRTLCGNGVCESGESSETCYVDCAPTTARFYRAAGKPATWLALIGLIIGLLVFNALVLRLKKKGREKSKTQTRIDVLRDYISKGMEVGAKPRAIKHKLVDAGWDEELVDAVIEELEAAKPQNI